MVRDMALIKNEMDTWIWTLRNPHILMMEFIVDIEMMVLAVVEEDIQEGLRAGRGGTR
jgi:hypothetical protein